MAFFDEDDGTQKGMEVVIPEQEEVLNFFKESGLETEMAEEASNMLLEGLRFRQQFENLAFLGEYAMKLLIVTWCYFRFDREPVSTLSHVTHELKSRARGMGRNWKIFELISRKLTYNELDRLSHAAIGSVAFLDLRTAAKLVHAHVIQPLSDSVWIDDTEIYHTYCSAEVDSITFIGNRFQAKLVLREPLTVDTGSGVHTDYPKDYKTHREARRAINSELCRAAFKEYFCEYEIDILNADDNEVSAIDWIEEPEDLTPEDEKLVTVIRKVSDRSIILAAMGGNEESQFIITKRLLKNSTTKFKEWRAEENRKLNGGIGYGTENEQVWKKLWKEAKKTLRASVSTAGWVPIENVRATMQQDAHICDTDMIAFLERHDCLGRFHFKKEDNGNWMGRALYHHTDPNQDLTKDDDVYELLKVDPGDDVAEYISENKIEGCMYGKWEERDGYMTQYNFYPLFPCDTYERSVIYMTTEKNRIDSPMSHFLWEISYLLSLGVALRRIRESRFGRFLVVTVHDNPDFVDKNHIRIPLPPGEIWKYSGIGGKTLVDIQQCAIIRQDNMEEAKKQKQQSDLKKRIKDGSKECIERLRKAATQQRGDPSPTEKIEFPDYTKDLPEEEAKEVKKQVNEAVEKEALKYHLAVKWMQSSDNKQFISLTSNLTTWVSEKLLLGKFSYKDHSHIKKALTHEAINSEFNFERQEFLGDGVMDYCVAYDIFQIDRNNRTSKRARCMFTPTTQNGHKTEEACGLLPITKSLFENQTHLLVLATHVDNANKKLWGDVYEAILGGVFLDDSMGMHVAHDLLRAHSSKYGALTNLYKSDLASQYIFDDSAPLVHLKEPLFRTSEYVLPQTNTHLSVVGGGFGKKKSTTNSGGGSGYDSILSGMIKVHKSSNKDGSEGCSTHFKFMHEASSYIRSFSNNLIHSQMIRFLKEGVVGYTNESITKITRLGMDLDGVSALHTREFPSHPVYGSWSLAEIVQEYVCSRVLCNTSLNTTCVLLDISRPEKNSQHLHWPYIVASTPQIVKILEDMQHFFCDLEIREMADTDPVEYIKNSTCKNHECTNKVVFAYTKKSGDTYNVGLCDDPNCKSEEKDITKTQVDNLPSAVKENLRKELVLLKWTEFIDANPFKTHKLRMYLSDKCEKTGPNLYPKNCPVRQKQILLPTTAEVRPKLLYDFDGTKIPEPHSRKPPHKYALPVTNDEMLKLASLRHPTYITDTLHGAQNTSNKGYWNCIDPHRDAVCEEVVENPGFDTLFATLLHGYHFEKPKELFLPGNEQSPWQKGECAGQTIELTVWKPTNRSGTRMELWLNGDMIVEVEQPNEKDVDKKARMELMKIAEPEECRKLEKMWRKDPDNSRLLELWDAPNIIEGNVVIKDSPPPSAPKQQRKTKSSKQKINDSQLGKMKTLQKLQKCRGKEAARVTPAGGKECEPQPVVDPKQAALQKMQMARPQASTPTNAVATPTPATVNSSQDITDKKGESPNEVIQPANVTTTVVATEVKSSPPPQNSVNGISAAAIADQDEVKKTEVAAKETTSQQEDEIPQLVTDIEMNASTDVIPQPQLKNEGQKVHEQIMNDDDDEAGGSPEDPSDEKAEVSPEPADLDVVSSTYWYELGEKAGREFNERDCNATEHWSRYVSAPCGHPRMAFLAGIEKEVDEVRILKGKPLCEQYIDRSNTLAVITDDSAVDRSTPDEKERAAMYSHSDAPQIVLIPSSECTRSRSMNYLSKLIKSHADIDARKPSGYKLLGKYDSPPYSRDLGILFLQSSWTALKQDKETTLRSHFIKYNLKSICPEQAESIIAKMEKLENKCSCNDVPKPVPESLEACLACCCIGCLLVVVHDEQTLSRREILEIEKMLTNARKLVSTIRSKKNVNKSKLLCNGTTLSIGLNDELAGSVKRTTSILYDKLGDHSPSHLYDNAVFVVIKSFPDPVPIVEFAAANLRPGGMLYVHIDFCNDDNVIYINKILDAWNKLSPRFIL